VPVYFPTAGPGSGAAAPDARIVRAEYDGGLTAV
jgi:hypothetical protein